MSQPKIKSINDQGSFDEIVAKSGPDIQKIARDLRLLIADVFPGVTEVPWKRQRVAGYGVGPKKMSEHFCYIAPAKGHVNLGFLYGTELSDPGGLLEGTGKRLRHVKIRSQEAAKSPALKRLIVQASRHLPRLKS